MDESGAPVAGARLVVQSPQGSILQERLTAADGLFNITGLSIGSYVLRVAARSFQDRQLMVRITPSDSSPIAIVLSLDALRDEVTVTASRGAVDRIGEAAQVVTAIDRADFQPRPLVTVGDALEGSAGIAVQHSTYGQVSPFLRGLTGYHILNLIDGIRFNNSTFRSGPNQYLAFVDSSQVERVEALLGPAGSQYGSDSMGGAIHLITLEPRFSSATRADFHGDLQTFAGSADASAGTELTLSLSSARLAWLLGGSSRRHNDLRAGGGNDSRHVFRRFLGLSAEQVRNIYGDRQQDTGFTQYGWHTKLSTRLAADQNLTLWYQRNDLRGVRSYKDVWGGLGRVRSDFEPQGLHFFYARHEKLNLGFLDTVAATFSLNAQSDGTIRQGLRSTDMIIRDNSRINSYGYSVQGTTHMGKRQALVFGGEIYDERVRARRVETTPKTNRSSERRALYPNGSLYTTYGLFAQNTTAFAQGKLRALFGGRFTRVHFRTFADRNRAASGISLGVTDASQIYQDLTFNTSLAWQINELLGLHILVGRGFRAPNLNDLGALGLNDLGYEIPSEAAAPFGALIGASDGEDAVSTGRNAGKLTSERLFNYELGFTARHRRFYSRTHLFEFELKDPIVRRTLLFPAGLVPASLSGLDVVSISPSDAQRGQGVAGVATSLDPRAVKAFVNDGRARYYGVETIFRYSLSARLSADGNYSYVAGRELSPNRPVRRLPPQRGFVALRYQPAIGKPWIELSGSFAGAQKRLSGGDLTDERIGASRRRRDITDFFQGSLLQSLIQGDTFVPTGETVAQIRDRVLPLGAILNGVKIADDDTRVPLFLATPGFLVLNVRAGIHIGENVGLNIAVLNLLDRNYRTHGSGVDAPGITTFASLKYSF